MRNDWRQKKLLITIGQKTTMPKLRKKIKFCFVALKNWNYSY